MDLTLKNMKLLVQMIAMTLGIFAEVSLCNKEKYVCIENPITPEKKAGSPIGDDEKYIFENEELHDLPFLVNYKSLLPNMTKLRLSSFFFRDDGTDDIRYIMTIRMNVNHLVQVRDFIDIFINGETNRPKKTEKINQIPKLNLSSTAIIEEVIAEGTRRYATTTDRMTVKEKQSLIREMFSRGIFLIKGSIAEVSSRMGNSEATIYRYLKELENKD